MHLSELGFDRFAVLASPGCYLNHSCDPNAMRHGVNVFAWRAIERGEEITIDYRLNAFGSSSWTCECGSENCTGTVVGSFAIDRAVRSYSFPMRRPSSVASTTDADKVDRLPQISLTTSTVMSVCAVSTAGHALVGLRIAYQR